MHITSGNYPIITQRPILLGAFLLLAITANLQAIIAPPDLMADCHDVGYIEGVETKLFTFCSMNQSGGTGGTSDFLLIGKQVGISNTLKMFTVNVTLTKKEGTKLFDFKFKPGNEIEVDAEETATGVKGDVGVFLGKSIVVTGKYKLENADDSTAKNYTATIHVASFRVYMNDTPTYRNNSELFDELDDVVFTDGLVYEANLVTNKYEKKDWKKELVINNTLKGDKSHVNVTGITDVDLTVNLEVTEGILDRQDLTITAEQNTPDPANLTGGTQSDDVDQEVLTGTVLTVADQEKYTICKGVQGEPAIDWDGDPQAYSRKDKGHDLNGNAVTSGLVAANSDQQNNTDSSQLADGAPNDGESPPEGWFLRNSSNVSFTEGEVVKLDPCVICKTSVKARPESADEQSKYFNSETETYVALSSTQAEMLGVDRSHDPNPPLKSQQVSIFRINTNDQITHHHLSRYADGAPPFQPKCEMSAEALLKVGFQAPKRSANLGPGTAQFRKPQKIAN